MSVHTPRCYTYKLYMHTYVQWYICMYLCVAELWQLCCVAYRIKTFLYVSRYKCLYTCLYSNIRMYTCTYVHTCVALDCTIHTYICMYVPLVWNVSTGDGCMYVCMYVLVCAPSANYSCSLRALCSRQSHPPPSFLVPHHCTARSKQGAASSGTPDHRSQRWPVQPRPPL